MWKRVLLARPPAPRESACGGEGMGEYSQPILLKLTTSLLFPANLMACCWPLVSDSGALSRWRAFTLGSLLHSAVGFVWALIVVWLTFTPAVPAIAQPEWLFQSWEWGGFFLYMIAIGITMLGLIVTFFFAATPRVGSPWIYLALLLASSAAVCLSGIWLAFAVLFYTTIGKSASERSEALRGIINYAVLTYLAVQTALGCTALLLFSREANAHAATATDHKKRA